MSTMETTKQQEVFKVSVAEIIHLKEAQDFDQAIAQSSKLYREALENKDYYFTVQALHHHGSVYKILAKHTREKSYARLSWLFFKEAEKLADEGGLPIEEKAVAKFLLGQSEILLENYQEAVGIFEGALETIQKSNRSKSQKGDFKKHLGEALCLARETDSGLDLIREALVEIKTFDGPDSFTNHVWETGALLALAKFTKGSDLPQAQAYAQEALEISTIENLPIRQKEARSMLKELDTSVSS